MVKSLLGACLVIGASLAAWGVVVKTHPVFVATEALAASRAAGVLTEEMSAEVDHEDFKSALVTFAIWGGIVGLAFGVSNPLEKNKLPLRVVVGLLLGAIGGLSAAYISNRYARFSEPPLDFGTYWLVRWLVVLLPMMAAFGTVATLGAWSFKALVENVVRVGVGIVLAVCLYVFSMGLITPIEQSQYIFPGFWSSSALLMISVGMLSFLFLSIRTGKPAENSTTETEVASDNTPS